MWPPGVATCEKSSELHVLCASSILKRCKLVHEVTFTSYFCTFLLFLEKMGACNKKEIRVVHQPVSLTLRHCLLPSRETLVSCPKWMHHEEAASLLNATSVPCPLCSLCTSSRPCPYKEVTAQRGWRGRSLPTGGGTAVQPGIRGSNHLSPCRWFSNGTKVQILEVVTHQAGFRKAACTHTIYESQYHNVTFVTRKSKENVKKN